MTDSTGISTGELWARLFKAPTVGGFLVENSGVKLPKFPDYIARLADERGLKREAVISAAGIERTFGYRLFSGARNPSRDTVLQLAFGFGLTTDETQQLCKVAEKSPLHPKVKRDAVIAYAVHNGCSLMDVQQLLFENGLPLLGGAKHE